MTRRPVTADCELHVLIALDQGGASGEVSVRLPALFSGPRTSTSMWRYEEKLLFFTFLKTAPEVERSGDARSHIEEKDTLSLVVA